MTVPVLAGTTNLLQEVTILSASTGQPLPGLSVASTTGLYGAYRIKGTAGGYTTFTLTGTGTLGSWASGWFKEIDSALAVGRYEVGLPNVLAGTASQGDYVEFVFAVSGGGGVTPAYLEIPIVQYDPQDSQSLGLTNVRANVIRQATAQAGAAGTITLDAGASATTGFYVGQTIMLVSGNGAGQASTVTAYNGGTKVATVVTNWQTNPNSSTVFRLVPGVAGIIDKSGFLLAAAGSAALDQSVPGVTAAPTLAQALGEIRAIMARNSVSGTTVTTLKPDGTVWGTYTIDTTPNPNTINRTT